MGTAPPVQRALHERCAQCGHSWSFHQKALLRECRAMGCKGGERAQRCPGFIPIEAARLSAVS